MSDKAIVEAALFVSTESVTPREISRKTGVEEKTVRESLKQLKQEYEKRGLGIIIQAADSRYRMTVNPRYEETVMHFVPETDMPKAMVKTLALISYEQPIKQSYVVKIRGNRAYHYIKKLAELGLVEARVQGRTKILSTTPKFKKYFNLKKEKKK